MSILPKSENYQIMVKIFDFTLDVLKVLPYNFHGYFYDRFHICLITLIQKAVDAAL